jgi:hypothetical protein
LITNPKQNKSKLKLELVQIINTAIGDVLSKAEKKKTAGKKMSKQVFTEVKNIFDTALAMTALMNKDFKKTYTDFYKMHGGIEDKLSKKRKWDTDGKEEEYESKSDYDEESDVYINKKEESSDSKADCNKD